MIGRKTEFYDTSILFQKMEEYSKFKKQTYESMITFWRDPKKLSYIIRVPELNDIISKVPELTKEKIMEDFKKYPLVKDACMSIGQVVIFPK